MTLEGFDEWDKENKSKYPIRFFIQETLPYAVTGTFNYYFSAPLRNVYWAIIHRLIKQHQYNIIRPRTLPPGFYDEETRILHSVMECLVEHVEINNSFMDWDKPPEELLETYAVMREVYDWWVNEYPTCDRYDVHGHAIPTLPTLPPEWGSLAMLRPKYDDEPLMKNWVRVNALIRANEKAWFAKEQEMLTKVITIRKYLWD